MEFHARLIGHTETIAKLIDCGADANAKDFRGRSSLHYAAINGYSIPSLKRNSSLKSNFLIFHAL